MCLQSPSCARIPVPELPCPPHFLCITVWVLYILYVCMMWGTCHSTCVRSQDNFVELVLSFHLYLCSKDGTRLTGITASALPTGPSCRPSLCYPERGNGSAGWNDTALNSHSIRTNFITSSWQNDTKARNFIFLFLAISVSLCRWVFQYRVKVWNRLWSPSPKQFWNPCPWPQCQRRIPECTHERRTGSVLRINCPSCLTLDADVKQQMCVTELFLQSF